MTEIGERFRDALEERFSSYAKLSGHKKKVSAKRSRAIKAAWRRRKAEARAKAKAAKASQKKSGKK